MIKIIESLKELAYDRGYVINKLRDSSDNRYEHLLKLYFYRDTKPNEVNHWCKEVANYSQISNSRTKIKLKDLIKYLWNEPKDDYSEKDINIILDNFEYEGYPKTMRFNYKNVYNYLKEFNVWVAEKMNNEEKIRHLDVVNKVKELLNKYSIN